MTPCRFMHQNLIIDPGQITPSSARPGLVGLPVANARGSALASALGEHTGPLDQVFLAQIDSVAAGTQVGQATFRWRRADRDQWEGVGLSTSAGPQEMTDGVLVKWVSGQGQDFFQNDMWTILASRAQGAAALIDSDRDTEWESAGCQDEGLSVDLGSDQTVTALILSDHNLSPAAQVSLLADPGAGWEHPAYSLALTPQGPHLVRFLQHSSRYWRLKLSDPGNPRGALTAGGLYLGSYFEPSRTFSARYSKSLVAGRAITATDAGKIAGHARGLAQAWQVSFSGLTEDDLAGFELMFRQVHQAQTGRLAPVWFTPFADDPGQTIYCLPGESFSPSHQHHGRYGLGLSLQEVVCSHA